MRTCIFCGGAVNSKEHVFGEGLIERMELADYPIRMGHRVEDKVTLRPTHGLAALTVKRVCRKCNNGWMSELEAWFLRRAGYLVEPTWPLLADAMIEQVQVEAERLACWGLKTAIMIDRSGISPKIPDSFASDLFKGNLPNSLRIDLATIKTTGLTRLPECAWLFRTKWRSADRLAKSG